MTRPPRRRLPATVVALAAVSFATDAATEMIYPLLPLFLTTTLGAGAVAVGVMEGLAETVAALLKLLSGAWSDRLTRRKPLMVLGYGLAGLVRPLIAFATSVPQVLTVRLLDRVGKGLRGAPRDALIADVVAAGDRGRAFGFHRAADHAGALVGPLIAFALLSGWGLPLEQVFLWAWVPGLVALWLVLFAVRETPRRELPPRRPVLGAMPRAPGFGRYLAVLFVFALGNSSDALLLLRAVDLGVPAALLPLLWALHNLLKSALSTAGGAWSDRLGRRAVIGLGWGLYAVVYLGFALATSAWHAWALFALYSVFYALTEGAEKALVADLVPAAERGAGFGWFHATVGLAALPASVLGGLLWDTQGPAVAFGLGAACAGLAAVGLGLWVRESVAISPVAD